MGKMAVPMSNVDEIRDRVILGEFGVKNVCVTFSNYTQHRFVIRLITKWFLDANNKDTVSSAAAY